MPINRLRPTVLATCLLGAAVGPPPASAPPKLASADLLEDVGVLVRDFEAAHPGRKPLVQLALSPGVNTVLIKRKAAPDEIAETVRQGLHRGPS